jgi:hypothetical protein
VHQDQLKLQSRRQPLGCVAEVFFAQGDLFVVLGVHEVVVRAVGVEILHLVLFERSAVDRVGRTKAMFKGRSGTNISQLGLHHRPQIAGCMVTEFDDFARLAFENDNHAASNLGCRNCHKTEVSV